MRRSASLPRGDLIDPMHLARPADRRDSLAHSRGGSSERQRGGFRPTLRVATRDLGGAVEIRVHDNGIVIASEHRGRLFKPSFHDQANRRGHRAWAVGILRHRHPAAWWRDQRRQRTGEFTEFTLRLPRGPRTTGEDA